MNHLLSNWFYANTSNRSWYDVIESSTVRQDVCPTIGLAGLRISFRDSSVQATQYFEQDVLMLNPNSNTEFKPTRLAFIPLRSLHGAVGFLFPTLSPPVIPFVFQCFRYVFHSSSRFVSPPAFCDRRRAAIFSLCVPCSLASCAQLFFLNGGVCCLGALEKSSYRATHTTVFGDFCCDSCWTPSPLLSNNGCSTF